MTVLDNVMMRSWFVGGGKESGLPGYLVLSIPTSFESRKMILVAALM